MDPTTACGSQRKHGALTTILTTARISHAGAVCSDQPSVAATLLGVAPPTAFPSTASAMTKAAHARRIMPPMMSSQPHQGMPAFDTACPCGGAYPAG